MPRGAVIQHAYQERIRAEKDLQLVTTGCLWCKVKPVTTTLAEGRLWLEAHVAEHHPDRVVVRRFGKRRSSHRMLGKQSIEDNIAAARAQGASAWVNQEQPEWA
jgi:hypothetical protein